MSAAKKQSVAIDRKESLKQVASPDCIGIAMTFPILGLVL
jgi:hypothetical protein